MNIDNNINKVEGFQDEGNDFLSQKGAIAEGWK